jgi:hypothetical protein
MSVKNIVSVGGVLSISFGMVIIATSNQYILAFEFIILGLAMAVVIMFWGFSGKFEQIIEKHTGLYDLDNESKSTKKQPTRRKW